MPAYVESGNEPEFIAVILQKWLEEPGGKTLYVDLWSPWQNGFVESFYYKFRRECLNSEIFYTLSEARYVIEK